MRPQLLVLGRNDEIVHKFSLLSIAKVERNNKRADVLRISFRDATTKDYVVRGLILGLRAYLCIACTVLTYLVSFVAAQVRGPGRARTVLHAGLHPGA